MQIALQKVGQIVYLLTGVGELLKEFQPLIKLDERILFFLGGKKKKMKFCLKRENKNCIHKKIRRGCKLNACKTLIVILYGAAAWNRVAVFGKVLW